MSFSNQSIYALPNAPAWNHKDQLVDSGGNVAFDEPAWTEKQYQDESARRRANQVGGGIR